MGAFILTRANLQQRDPTVEARAVQSLAEQGFVEPRLITLGNWRARVFPKLNGTEPTIVHGRGDDCAFCVGTLLYDDLTGVDALKCLLTKFAPGETTYSRARGIFCAVLQKQGVCCLLTDAVGQFKVYWTADWDLVSSSFVAALAATSTRTPVPQGIYEYVFEGATFGEHTVVREIGQVPGACQVELGKPVRIRAIRNTIPVDVSSAPARQQEEDLLGALKDWFRMIARAFDGRVDMALSGGYDSRLMLALLRAVDVTPRLHVYGAASDDDVRIAKLIAEGERLQLNHIDKKALMPAATRDVRASARRNFLAFDGYPVDGIFDTGADLATRRERSTAGHVALNGGGGEIFRNFFYLPNRTMSARALLWSFYGQFDPTWCTQRLNLADYYESLTASLTASIDAPPGKPLSRLQVEALYPYFRCRFWTGRNGSVNSRFGHSLTPFLEADLIARALRIPLRRKNHGRFESALIRASDASLAAYPSAYGHDFSGAPSVRRHVRDYLTIARPPWMRRLSFRLRHRMRRVSPALAARLDEVRSGVDAAFPCMREFFHMDRVTEPQQLGRACTLEYLFAWRPGGISGAARQALPRLQSARRCKT